jgi:hypothetical protein
MFTEIFFREYKQKPGGEKETWMVGREIFTLSRTMPLKKGVSNALKLSYP